MTQRVAIVGGGLAGMAAALALRDQGLAVDLYEARRYLGGRAASFTDPVTGELVDLCQHISMGCCTNLRDFCLQTGIADQFRCERSILMLGQHGKSYLLKASLGWPAPLHLFPSFLRLRFLSLRERWSLAQAIWRLMRMSEDQIPDQTMLFWLRQQRQSAATMTLFWETILVSALSESLVRISVAAARQVIIEGFCANREGYFVEIPRVSLGEIYSQRLSEHLVTAGVKLRLGDKVQQVAKVGDQLKVQTPDDSQSYNAVVVATPWHQLERIVEESLQKLEPWISSVDQWPTGAISGLHLWFDQPIMDHAQVALLGRVAQWVFAREQSPVAPGEWYYQVVISASQTLLARHSADEVLEIVQGELRDLFPECRQAELIRWKLVTDPSAVLSPLPGIEAARPSQTSQTPGLFWSGDWTQTGWPSTMEGAVRGGRLAAEAVLGYFGNQVSLLTPDLKRGLLARCLIRR